MNPAGKPANRLKRGIGRLDFIALVVNAVIGAGILGLPGRVYGLVQEWTLVVLAGTTILIAVFALCFAELASRFERTGGPYLYVSAAFGPVPGFTVGWLLWLSRVLTIATQLNLLLEYGAPLFSPSLEFIPRFIVLIALGMGFLALTLAGVGPSARTSTIFTAIKILLFATFIAAGIAMVDVGRLVPQATPDPTALSDAVLLLLFAFFGFEIVTVVAGETRNPRRIVPVGLLTGVAIIALIYGLVAAVTIGVLPDPATSERAVTVAAHAVAGPTGTAITTIGAVAILLGALAAAFLLAPRLLFALAEDGQLPAIFARVSPRRQTPDIAILVTVVAATLVAIFSGFLSALLLATSVRLLAYVVCCLSLIQLRRTGQPCAFHAPMGVVLAMLGVVVGTYILFISGTGGLLVAAVATAVGLLLRYLTIRRRTGGAFMPRDTACRTDPADHRDQR